MAKNKEVTPKDYDRWGKTCVIFTDNTSKKAEKTPKKVVKTATKGK